MIILSICAGLFACRMSWVPCCELAAYMMLCRFRANVVTALWLWAEWKCKCGLSNALLRKELLMDLTTLPWREDILHHSPFQVIGTFEIWLAVVSKENMNINFGCLPTDLKSEAGPKLWNIGDIFAAPVKPAAASLGEAGGAVRRGDSWLVLLNCSSTVEFGLSEKLRNMQN